MAEDLMAGMKQDQAPIAQAPAARDDVPQGADFKPGDKPKDLTIGSEKYLIRKTADNHLFRLL